MRVFRGKCCLIACVMVAISLQSVVAGEKLPFVNNSGSTVVAIYAHAPGHQPWRVAGPLEDGELALLERETLQGCRRLVVRFDNAADIVAAAGGNTVQYFNNTSFGSVEEITLAPDSEGVPRLCSPR